MRLWFKGFEVRFEVVDSKIQKVKVSLQVSWRNNIRSGVSLSCIRQGLLGKVFGFSSSWVSSRCVRRVKSKRKRTNHREARQIQQVTFTAWRPVFLNQWDKYFYVVNFRHWHIQNICVWTCFGFSAVWLSINLWSGSLCQVCQTNK